MISIVLGSQNLLTCCALLSFFLFAVVDFKLCIVFEFDLTDPTNDVSLMTKQFMYTPFFFWSELGRAFFTPVCMSLVTFKLAFTTVAAGFVLLSTFICVSTFWTTLCYMVVMHLAVYKHHFLRSEVCPTFGAFWQYFSLPPGHEDKLHPLLGMRIKCLQWVTNLKV